MHNPFQEIIDLNEGKKKEEKINPGDYVHLEVPEKGTGVCGFVVHYDDKYVYIKDIHNRIHRGSVDNIRKMNLHESEDLYEEKEKEKKKEKEKEKEEKIRLGNYVHLGFSEKGGYGVYGFVVHYNDKYVYVKDRNNKIYRGLIKNVRKITIEESVEESENLNEEKETLKVGDFVHVGLKNKDGHGFYGTVEKIDGEYVYIKNKDNKLYRGLIKNTTKVKFEDLKPTELKHPELVHKLTGRKFSFSENKEIFEDSEQLSLIRKLMAQRNENLYKNIDEETKKEETNKMKSFADFINTLDWKYDPEWLKSIQKGPEVKHTDRYVIVRDKDKGITRVTRKYNPETGLTDDPSDHDHGTEGQTQTQPVKRGRGRPPGKYGTYKSYNKTGKYVGVHAARKQKAQEAFEHLLTLESENEIEEFMNSLDEETFADLCEYIEELNESEKLKETLTEEELKKKIYN